MEYTLAELFPELNVKLNPAVYTATTADLEKNTYFTQLVESIKD